MVKFHLQSPEGWCEVWIRVQVVAGRSCWNISYSSPLRRLFRTEDPSDERIDRRAHKCLVGGTRLEVAQPAAGPGLQQMAARNLDVLGCDPAEVVR